MQTAIAIPNRLTDQSVLPFPTVPLQQCVIDASHLEWVEPTGLVQLVLLLHRAVELSTHVTFVAPDGYELGHYLARMGFYERIPQSVTRQNAIDPKSVRRRSNCDVLVTVRGFKTDGDVEDLMADLAKFLQRMVVDNVITGRIFSTLAAAIPELAGNAASHAASPCGGFIAAQSYRRGSYLAVGDLGMGIRRHLTRNPRWSYLVSDEEAIKKALEPGVSGTADRRGYGYDYVLDELEQTAGAELFIRSGYGWVKTAVTKSGRKRTSGTDPGVEYPGTLIQLLVRS